MEAVAQDAPQVGTAPVCRALGVPRASIYRLRKKESAPAVAAVRPTPKRALTKSEQQRVLDVLHEDRFVDQAPAQVWATLLDEGKYLCSIRTMYRILEANAEVRERRNQLRHPNYAKPELIATAPNETWSWDITKLKGPVKWTYYYLYVIMDIFSRYVVGWMVAERESGELAKRLVKETCLKQGVKRDQLTLHADRGSSMKSKCLALMLSDLGITKTYSRPQVSNDNPFSESQFKTLKYRPEFPNRFGSIEDARAFCRTFFNWYNFEHRHSGIALLTPHMVHYGLAAKATRSRQVALDQAYGDHPERFVNKAPKAPVLPGAVWINPPADKQADDHEDAIYLLASEQTLRGVIAT